MQIEKLSEHGCYGGTVGFYRHRSDVNGCDMRFSVFVPAAARSARVPVLTYLAGLTCTEETFMIKAGAQRDAARLGLMLVAPDTSPRGEGVADDPEGDWDFGLGAGFYLDAVRSPWADHYNMYSYVTEELAELIDAQFPSDPHRQGIFGHSMGGHGALTIGVRNPDRYRSISAFAPICAPMQCPWGRKAFSGYLGDDADAWRKYDASELIGALGDGPERPPLRVDQGLADQFLDEQLHPDLLEKACKNSGYPLDLRRHENYDHGYYFIASFVREHLNHHARCLGSV